MNWKPLAARSNWVQSGRATTSPATAPARAVIRATAGLRLPTSSTSPPARIGTQMTRVRIGNAVPIMLFPRPASSRPHEYRQQQQHADDHRKRIVVDIAGLHAAQHCRSPSHDAGGAVDEKAVDRPDVAALPQPRAEPARSAREKPVVEAVESILLVQDPDHEARLLTQHRRQVGPRDIEVPRDRSACDRKPEWQRA